MATAWERGFAGCEEYEEYVNEKIIVSGRYKKVNRGFGYVRLTLIDLIAGSGDAHQRPNIHTHTHTHTLSLSLSLCDCHWSIQDRSGLHPSYMEDYM